MAGLLVFSSFLGIYTINLVHSDTQYVRSMNVYYVKSVITSIILDDYARLSNSTGTESSAGRCISSEILLSQPLDLSYIDQSIILKDAYTSREFSITPSMLRSVFNDIKRNTDKDWNVYLVLGNTEGSITTQDLIINVCLQEQTRSITITFSQPGKTS